MNFEYCVKWNKTETYSLISYVKPKITFKYIEVYVCVWWTRLSIWYKMTNAIKDNVLSFIFFLNGKIIITVVTEEINA